MKTIAISVFFFITSLLIYPQWIQQNSGTTKSFHNLYFLNENLGWVCGYDGTILKTSDGGQNWISHNLGTLDDVHAIYFKDPSIGWAVLYEYVPDRHGSIIHTTDGGDIWNVQLSEWGNTLHSIHFSDENNGWVAGSNGIVFHTTNGGTTWFQQYPPTGGGWLWPIFFIDNNIGWTIGDPLFGLFKSTNGGNNWVSYYVPMVVQVLSIVFLDNQTGWLCGAQGQIVKSIDGGITWQNLQSGTSEYLRDIYFIDYNTGWCVGHNGTILYTVNGGTSWNSEISNTSEILRAVQFVNNQVGWVVGENGIILKTVNGGIPVELISFTGIVEEEKIVLSWRTATETNNSGFEIERKTKDMEFVKIGFVAGFGTTTEPKIYRFVDEDLQRGIYFYRLKQIDFNGTYEYSNEISVDFTIPVTYNFYQNYLNPFNPTTRIRFALSEKAYTTLKICNSLGEIVEELVNEVKEAGNYEVNFDASGLPSGMYLYSLSSGKFKETKKMILLR